MRTRVTWVLSLLALVLATSQDAPVAQQEQAGQAPAGRGRSAEQSEAQRNYKPPVRSPINRTVTTTRPVTDAMLRNPDPGDWLMYRRTYDAQSFSPLDQVNKSNVRGLQLVWSWGIEKGASPNVDDWVGPIVHDGVMYLSMPGGVVHALDAATGDFLWQYRHQMAKGTSAGATGGIRGGIVLYEDKAFIHPADGKIDAINVRDGTKAFEGSLYDAGDGHTPSSGTGLAADGKIISGVDCAQGVRCFIGAIDAKTGARAWRTYTTAAPGEPGGDTWEGIPLEKRGATSGNPWITGSFDPILHLTYWGATQAKPWHRKSRGEKDGMSLLYTDSTLALDTATGKMAWYHQYVPGESFDLDEIYEFINVDIPGYARKSGFEMGKSGVLWHLDRQTGRLIRATDTGLQNMMEIDPERGFVRYRPEVIDAPMGQPVYTCPSTSGFKNSRQMSYNPATQAFYIPMSLNCSTRVYTPGSGADEYGGECCRVNLFHPDFKGLAAQVLAMDVFGKTLWTHRQATQFSTPVMTTAGGLVFVGDTDRYMYALDLSTGNILWKSPRMATKMEGSPITFRVKGRQYFAFITGASMSHNWITTVARELNPEVHWPQAGFGVWVFALPQ
ncbi:MAG: putative alcohol dehydrogenase precursor [Acidobacteria bacterium]|nr:putative alcohol dehydrogenase precursor [Acidobacteriota bacterium]